VPDFTLTPDEPALPLQPQRVRLVSSGVHPTEAVPKSRRTGTDATPVDLPCPYCAQPIVLGTTREGTRLFLDRGVPTYSVLWASGEALPRLALSRAYPLHVCGRLAPDGPQENA
jgi:hypothetical protein